jgi:hypothetical protein
MKTITEFPDIELEVSSSPVTSKTRRLRTQWTIESADGVSGKLILHETHGVGHIEPGCNGTMLRAIFTSTKGEQHRASYNDNIIIEPTPVDIARWRSGSDMEWRKLADCEPLRAIHNVDSEKELVAAFAQQIREEQDQFIITDLLNA